MLAFILAVIAGFLVPLVEGVLRGPLESLTRGRLELELGETRVITFILMMMVVGVFGWVWNSGGVFWVMLGGALGLFALRLVGLVQGMVSNSGGKD